ncbi:MAG: hypothetical protein PHV68_09130 [Candidatus Gastranaerophilales bacterium]|nr:hypothetical protein [Candidatus Gastranaerophilales bacterium]
MAITQSYDFQGVTISNAYIRVDRVFGGKREGWNSVVSVYASQEASETCAPLEQLNQSAPYDDGEMNPYKKLYAALKAEKFKEATDC